jgi:xylan 1,4-beta-xylosidase
MLRYYNITTMVDFDASASNHEAGIRILSGNNDLTIKLCSGFNGSKKIKFYFGTTSYEATNSVGTKVWLKLERKGQSLSGYFSADGLAWTKVGSDINVASLDKSQTSYNQWVGNSIALYASNKTADFDLFMFKDGFSANRAEAYLNKFGVTKVTKTPGAVMTNSASGDWLMMPGIDLGTQDKGAKGIVVNVASTGTGSLEVWQGNIGGSGKLLCTVPITSTGGVDTWKDFNASVTTSGQQDIYLRWVGGANSFFVNTIKFTQGIVTESSDIQVNKSELATIYPNPFINSTSIESKGQFEYSIFDLKGSLIEQGTANNNVSIGNALKNGNYIVNIHNGVETKTLKISKTDLK